MSGWLRRFTKLAVLDIDSVMLCGNHPNDVRGSPHIRELLIISLVSLTVRGCGKEWVQHLHELMICGGLARLKSVHHLLDTADQIVQNLAGLSVQMLRCQGMTVRIEVENECHRLLLKG